MFYKRVSLVTGGFDPIHSGHISYFARAKDFSDFLVVDAVITVPDDDQGSACGAIAKCLEIADTVVFCNGGDRGKTNTPETVKYGDDPRVKFEFGIGGNDKKNSSSWILRGYFDRQRKLLGI